MVTPKALPEDQAISCIENGEFSKEIITSNKHVAIVLTQSWCPDWPEMREAIEQLEEPDIDVWVLTYDLISIFEEFLEFKEDVFGNGHVPYVRYYRDGRLTGASNYVIIRDFLDLAKRR